LATAQGANWVLVDMTGEANGSEVLPRHFVLEVWELGAQVLDRGLVQLKLVNRVLRVHADAQFGIEVNVAIRGFELLDAELQERGLACSVLAHNGDATVHVDSKVHMLEERLLARVPECHILNLEKRHRELTGGREIELDDIVADDGEQLFLLGLVLILEAPWFGTLALGGVDQHLALFFLLASFS